MSIYGVNELMIGPDAQSASDGLAQRTRALADSSQLRFFERTAVRSMNGVANDTSRASMAYRVSLSEAAIRLYHQKVGIATAEPNSRMIL
ncbi:MAG: hypothetical protein HQM03_14605 [Magnetococcales bacterium]|nr:hypothetical protein [Magnetococcales bacterium]